MKRITAIQDILKHITDEVVITSTGYISREAYQVRDRDRNFYMQGSMGGALAIGLGIAYCRPDLKVIVISGDGAVLMGLGTLVLHKYLIYEHKLHNLIHYVLDNGVYATTGGQKTCSKYVDLEYLCPPTFTRVIKVSAEKGDAPRIKLSPKEIKERFCRAIIYKQE